MGHQIRNNALKKLKLPTVVNHLLNLKREKKFRPHKYKLTLNTAIRILTEKHREMLPEEIKDDVINKFEAEKLKQKMKLMTPEEKKAFKRERKRQLREQQAAALENSVPDEVNGVDTIQLSGPIEDQFLVRDSKSKVLPLFTPVELPSPLGNDMFGKLSMLCEFIYSYHTLFSNSRDFHKQFTVYSLAQAVTTGSAGFKLTSKLLVGLLQTLLTDEIAKDYSELDFNLSQVHIVPENSCELTRICLRSHDDEYGDDVTKKGEKSVVTSNQKPPLTSSDSPISSHVAESMMNNCDQVEVINALAYRVMNTYAVQMFMEETRQKAHVAWAAMCKMRRAEKKEQKEKEKTEGPKKRGPKPKQKQKRLTEMQLEMKKEQATEIDLCKMR